LSDACNYEQWVKLHSDFVHDLYNNYGYLNIKNKLRALIGDEKKVETIDLFITSPSTTKKLIGKVKNSHYKMFDGKNPYTKYIFNSKEENKAKDYLDRIDFDTFISEKIFNDYYVSPCSFYVVDLPKESTKTQPYITTVDCSSVTGAEYIGNELSFICFGDKEIQHVYCDEYYRVFEKNALGEFVAISEAYHGLGFCPAYQLSYQVNEKNPFKRWCPLSDYLNDLDYVVMYEGMLKVYEAYGPFPIITKFESDCTYQEYVGTTQEGEDEYTQEVRHYRTCNGGFMDYQGRAVIENGKPLKCPVCTERYYMGPGSLDIVPQPKNDDKGTSMLLDSPKIKNVDVAGLEYTFEKVKLRKNELEEGISGKIDLPDNKSVNESQIQASFERQREVISIVKKPIERVKINLSKAILSLISSQYIKTEHSLGTDWYIMGANDLMGMYNKSKEQKHSESILNFLFEEYLNSKYRNDHSKLVEALTWYQVDPWPHYNMMDILNFPDKMFFAEEDLLLKANLSAAINAFKAENNVVIFGEFLSENQRIEKIKSNLINYVRSKKTGESSIYSEVQAEDSQ